MNVRAHNIQHVVRFWPLIAVICVLGSLSSAIAANLREVDASNQAAPLSLADQTYVLHDPEGTLSFEQVIDPANRTRFTKGLQRSQYRQGIYWFQLLIPDDYTLASSLRLATGLRRALEIDLFTPAGGTEFNVQSVRIDTPLSGRPVPDSFIAFPIQSLPKDDGRALYLRINASASSEDLDPVLYSQDAFMAQILKRDYPSYFYNGMAFALGAFNFLLFLFLRDRIYFYYVLQVLFSMLWVDTSRFGTGFLFRYVWPNSGAFDAVSPQVCIGGFLIFFVLFASTFADLRVRSPRLFWLTWGLIGLSLSSTILSQSGIFLPISYTSTVLFVLTALMASLSLLSMKGDRSARLFLMAFLPYLILMFIYFGDINFNFGLKWPIPPNILGSSLEMLLMSLVLADRFNQARKEKYDAQALALEALQRSEQKLELMVEQRTQSLRETQAQLVHAEKMASLGTLVAGVAHEINTPLGIAVTATSQVIQEKDDLKSLVQSGQLSRNRLSEFMDRADNGLGIAYSNLTRAASLVTSFKQVAVDQNSEQAREIDLALYLNDVLKSLEPILKSNKVQVEQSIPVGLKLMTHPGALAQVITNLVQNAVKHAFEGVRDPKISFDYKNCAADQIQLILADNGMGMSESTRLHAFDPFFTTKRGMGGTGLGLHIVHNLMKDSLKGHIELESRPGQGTRFLMSFPAHGGT